MKQNDEQIKAKQFPRVIPYALLPLCTHSQEDLQAAKAEKERLEREVLESKAAADRYRELMEAREGESAESLQQAGREAILSAQYIRLSDEAMDMREKMERLQVPSGAKFMQKSQK